jgi:BlaI family transcriptional regulator, penicillinase repressor
MDRKSLDQLGALQRAVMEILWDKGQATVREVLEALQPRKQLAYTTVLSVMQKLDKLGWITHRSEKNTHVFMPARTRGTERTYSLQKLIRRVFQGDRLLAFEQLLTEEKLKPDELAALAKLIKDKERGRSK